MTTLHVEPGSAATFRSGTAARLAGIPVATLRVWERRYEVIGPDTSASGHRRYTANDVSRLTLIKSLVDAGHPIGAIAHLPTATLQELRTVPAAAAHAPTEARMRAAVVGESLAQQAAARPPAALDIVAAGADRGHAAESLHGQRAEVLAIELPALREDAAAEVDALAAQVGAARVVVAYRFGTQAAVRTLRERGCVVVRAPLDLSEVATLAALVPIGGELRPLPRAPQPRFDEAALAALGTAGTAMYCECPRHVVELLRSLGAFERYSAECLNRSPADAALHGYLERVAGTARTLFEEALVRVAQAEGLALPGAAAEAARHG